MKREGRQHGMVRSYEIGRPNYNKIVNKINSPATAGIFMKVSSKPTNHSKYTGKCGRARCIGCHSSSPVTKSKDKGKGTQKQRSFDVFNNHRLIAWKVGDRNGEGWNYSGSSAAAILGHLDDYYDNNEEEEEEEVEFDVDDDVYNRSDYCSSVSLEGILPVIAAAAAAGGIEEIDHEPGEGEDEEEEEEEDDGMSDDDNMSFCEVGFVLEEGDEGWFVVEEM